MPQYLHLKPNGAPTALEGASPFKAVLVIEDDVTKVWQTLVSDWLVQSGCRYMMAWGKACESWDDSVDWASLRMFDFGDIPDEGFVMTTWHNDESLDETFWFATHAANHPDLDLEETYVVHIAAAPREAEVMASFHAASVKPF